MIAGTSSLVAATLDTATTISPNGPQPDTALEQQMLTAMNQHRATLGLKPVVLLPQLVATSQWKACDLTLRGYIAHDDTWIPRDPNQRMIDFGYATYAGQYAWGEVIAWMWPTAAGALAAWLSEPLDGTMNHRAIIESDTWNCCGVGVAVAKAGTFGAPPENDFYGWVIDFGYHPLSSPQPPVVTPPAQLPLSGSKWRNKATGATVTVTSASANLVSYTNQRGRHGSLLLTAWVKRYTPTTS